MRARKIKALEEEAAEHREQRLAAEARTAEEREKRLAVEARTAEYREQRLAAEKKAALKTEEDRKIAEQRRQDSALVNTYTSDKEIDQRRDRELQVVDLQLTQLKTSLKKATEAEAASQKKHADVVKSGKPTWPALVDELARATDERKRIEGQIVEKQADKAAINKRYDEQKARYIELRGGSSTAPAAQTPNPTAAPTAKK